MTGCRWSPSPHLTPAAETRTVTSGSPVAATVVAVEPASADSGSPTVFSLLVSKGDADEVASLAAAGEASLVQVGAGS